MLWNRFAQDRKFLDLYENPRFDPATGVIGEQETIDAVAAIEEASHAVTKARACAYVLEHCAIDVNPKGWFGANFAGRVPKYVRGANRALEKMVHGWFKELIDGQPIVQTLDDMNESKAGAGAHFADHAHWVPDWDSALYLGFSGLRERARGYRKGFEQLTPEQEDYFESIEIMLTACIRFVGRLAELAEKRIREDERMPLRVQCLRQLEKGAPRDIYEALQFIYLFQLIGQFVEVAQVRSLGDIDRLLYPYYLRDLNRGAYTREQVKELLQYFFILYDFQNHKYNQPVSVGGTDVFGKPAFTDLTDLILDAYYDAELTNLKIHIFVNEDTPDSVLLKTMEMIRNGRGSFVYMNTDVGVKAMEKVYHQPIAPHMLGSQGCYNFNVKAFPQHANQTRINLPKAIELAFFEGVDPLSGYEIGVKTMPVEQMQSFDDFKQAFETQMDHLTKKHIEVADFYDGIMSVINPTPLFSSTFAFSLREARDCFEFGPTSILMMGIGTTADCLMMVKKHVFDQKDTTMAELKAALRADWEGYEALRMRLYSDPEKYGNNLDAPDQFAVELANNMIRRVTGRKNKRGSEFICHFETIDRCFRSGKVTGATPDGRKARTPFSKNLNAAFGQDRNGLTAMMQSACKLDATLMPIGAPVDFMLHSSATRGKEGLEAMVQLLRTFCRMGGYALQGNVLDAKTLREAQKNPERYQNLQVRVSGWNWNFVDMEKEYQDIFIMQAEAAE